MLGHQYRRLANIEPALGQRLCVGCVILIISCVILIRRRNVLRAMYEGARTPCNNAPVYRPL